MMVIKRSPLLIFVVSMLALMVACDSGEPGGPSVRIVSPIDGRTIDGAYDIKVQATSDSGVENVKFFIDGALIAEDNIYPFEVTWETWEYSDGTHSILAVAEDTSGARGEDEVEVTLPERTHWNFKILDMSDFEPVTDATVEMSDKKGKMPYPPQATDAEGMVRMEGLQKYEFYSIKLTAGGYADTYHTNHELSGWMSTSDTLLIVSNGVVSGMTMVGGGIFDKGLGHIAGRIYKGKKKVSQGCAQVLPDPPASYVIYWDYDSIPSTTRGHTSTFNGLYWAGGVPEGKVDLEVMVKDELLGSIDTLVFASSVTIVDPWFESNRKQTGPECK